MRFRYRLAKLAVPSVSLGGRFARPRPIIPIGVIGPLQTFPQDAWIDAGSDETLFPERLATMIGVDLSNAPTGQASGIGLLGGITVSFAEVRLRMTDGVEYREWPGWVGFSPSVRRPVLGFGGFLQFFTGTFFGDREEVVLEVNSLYPGT